jgi:hypothetical protein
MKSFKMLLSAIFLTSVLSACSSNGEPGDNIGSGRDERSISPCACVELKIKGNEGLDEYKTYLRKELVL